MALSGVHGRIPSRCCPDERSNLVLGLSCTSPGVLSMSISRLVLRLGTLTSPPSVVSTSHPAPQPTERHARCISLPLLSSSEPASLNVCTAQPRTQSAAVIIITRRTCLPSCPIYERTSQLLSLTQCLSPLTCLYRCPPQLLPQSKHRTLVVPPRLTNSIKLAWS